MAKTAFAVEDGLIPGHTASDLGHTTAKFRDTHLSNDLNASGDLNVTGSVFAGGEELTSGGGGGDAGGVDQATSIAYAIALG